MKIIFTLFILFCSASLFSQKSDDSKIIITLNDSTGIYNKVKYSLVYYDFIVKDNGNRDTLTTYSIEYDGIYCVARAIIKGNSVTLTGVYGLKKIDGWGYTQSPKGYDQVIYYKGSNSWKLLMQVANRMNGQISYGK
ncbi:MAG TPA: hypothetical protein VK483_01775 [Chitinophagaceae bacterium]|nr:hypothetical protein [Chitinophagaceae bacterium]